MMEEKEHGLWISPTGFESWLHHLCMSYVTLGNLYSLNLSFTLYTMGKYQLIKRW